MLAIIKENIGTVIVGAMLLAAVIAIVIKLVRDKRKGRPISCSCGCKSCPKASLCGKTDNNTQEK